MNARARVVSFRIQSLFFCFDTRTISVRYFEIVFNIQSILLHFILCIIYTIFWINVDVYKGMYPYDSPRLVEHPECASYTLNQRTDALMAIGPLLQLGKNRESESNSHWLFSLANVNINRKLFYFLPFFKLDPTQYYRFLLFIGGIFLHFFSSLRMENRKSDRLIYILLQANAIVT